VKISAALAADLALLTDALDDPAADIEQTVHRLAADVGSAVHSYVGLTVATMGSEPAMTFTVLADCTDVADVRASVMVPLPQSGGAAGDPGVQLILYATSPGAFVDLAADIAWLVGCKLSDIELDRHLIVADPDGAGDVTADASVNQALGVLCGRGMTLREAERELDRRAVAGGTNRRAAAARVLANLADDAADRDVDLV
jgi:hypothetical protein